MAYTITFTNIHLWLMGALLVSAFSISGCATIAGKQEHAELVDPVSDARQLHDEKMTIARLSEKRGVSDRAKTLYRQLAASSPNDPVAHHRLGVMAAKEGRYNEAMAHFQTARRLDPENAEILNDLGYAHYLRNDLKQAEEVLRLVVTRDPYNQRACNNLALIVGNQGRFEESFALFKKVGSAAEAHANLGYLYAMRGQFDKSLLHYEASLSHDKELKPAAEAIVSVNTLKKSSDLFIANNQLPPGSNVPKRLPSIETTQSNVALVEFHQQESPRHHAHSPTTEPPARD